MTHYAKFFTQLLLGLLGLSSLLFVGMTPITNTEKVVYDEVKVVSWRPKPIIEAHVNGVKTYFLLDTGSDITIIDLVTQKRLKFKTSVTPRDSKIQGIGKGESLVKDIWKCDVYLGNNLIKHNFLGVNLNLRKFRNMKHSANLVGIIGSDLMIKYGFRIDYNEKKVYIMKPKKKNVKPLEARK